MLTLQLYREARLLAIKREPNYTVDSARLATPVFGQLIIVEFPQDGQTSDT